MSKVVDSKILDPANYTRTDDERRSVRIREERMETCPFTQPERQLARLCEAPHTPDNQHTLEVEIWMCMGVYEKNKRTAFCANSCPFYRTIFGRPKTPEATPDDSKP